MSSICLLQQTMDRLFIIFFSGFSSSFCVDLHLVVKDDSKVQHDLASEAQEASATSNQEVAAPKPERPSLLSDGYAFIQSLITTPVKSYHGGAVVKNSHELCQPNPLYYGSVYTLNSLENLQWLFTSISLLWLWMVGSALT